MCSIVFAESMSMFQENPMTKTKSHVMINCQHFSRFCHRSIPENVAFSK